MRPVVGDSGMTEKRFNSTCRPAVALDVRRGRKSEEEEEEKEEKKK
jgi:hypothetical protein